MDTDDELMKARFEALAATAAEPRLNTGPMVRRVKRRRMTAIAGATVSVGLVLTGGSALAQNLASPATLGTASAGSSPTAGSSTAASPAPTSPAPDPSPTTLESPHPGETFGPPPPPRRIPQRRTPEPVCGTSAPGHLLLGTELNMNSSLGLAQVRKRAGGSPELTVVLTVTKRVTVKDGLLPRFELSRIDTEATVAWDVPGEATMADGSPLPTGTITLEPKTQYRMTMRSRPAPCAGETWPQIWSHISDYRLELSIPEETVFETATLPKGL